MLVAPFAATYSWLQMQKKSVKSQVKKQIIAGIEEEELVHLAFTIDESKSILDWEHENEFEFQGLMYDIVKSEIRGDSIFYICWLDKVESRLNNKLNEILARNLGDNPQNRNKQKQLIDFYKILIYEELADINFNLFQAFNSNYHEHFLIYKSIKFSPPNPPPQSV